MQDIEQLLFETLKAVGFGMADEVNNTTNEQKCKKCVLTHLYSGGKHAVTIGPAILG